MLIHRIESESSFEFTESSHLDLDQHCNLFLPQYIELSP